MSDLQLAFSSVYTKVSEFLILGSSPTGAVATKVKDLTYRGYRRFLLPLLVRNGRIHTWSFLRQEATIKMSAGVEEYPLPADFQYFWYAPEYGKNSNYPTPQPVTMQRMMSLRATIVSSSYPQYWSLSTLPYDVTVGTRYQLVIYPEANQTYTLHYGYITEPNKPTADVHFFIGGALMSECILECALAEAEAQEDDTVGIHTQRAKELIHECIELDLRRVPPTAGSANRGDIFWTDPTLARELRWVSAADAAYGTT